MTLPSISTAFNDDGVSPIASAHSAVAPWSLYTHWQRWRFVAILFLVTTSNYFDYFILSILLDPIKREFHVSDTQLGILSGLGFALVYAVAGLPIARWADRGNRRTIIAVTLTGWSAFTTLCGLAHSFVQLALVRFGVGALEPGAVPTAQSLIIDYFPAKRRSMAIAILTMGASAVGYLLGVVVGGQVAATLGWRSAFLMAGISGLVLALIVRFALAEPRSRLGFPKAAVKPESLNESIKWLRRKRSFVFVILGQSLCTVFAIAASMFFPSFMIRSFHATLTQVSGTWGFTIAAADLIGGLAGGWLADRLGRRDIRWYAWLPAIASALGVPIYWLALSTQHLWSFISVDFLAEFIFSIGLPPVFSAIHAVCGNRRRAMAIAILQMCFYFVGMGIGPTLVGALSDGFSAAYGIESLRYSLIATLTFLVPAAVAFYWASRSMRIDQELI